MTAHVEPVGPLLSIKPSDAELAHQLLSWLRDYIDSPHPLLGRSGPICPFVGPALDSDQLTIVLVHDVDGNDVDRVHRLVWQHAELLARSTVTGPARRLASVVLAFPNLPADRASVLDDVHAAINHELVRTGYVIAQFHSGCRVPATHNNDFCVQVGPIPCLAIRAMAEHDIYFLNDDEIRFGEYARRFGTEYRDGRVSDRKLVEIFWRTAVRFPSVDFGARPDA